MLEKMHFQVFYVLCFLLCYGNSHKLPHTFQRCKVSPEMDHKPNECLKNAVEKAIHLLADTDNKDAGTLDMDPLRVNQILIQKGETSPVAVRLEFIDNNLMGLSSIKVESINGKLSSPKDFEFVMISSIKQLQLIGPYTVGGKVLILPIQGVGRSNMTLNDIKSIVTIKGEPNFKNGKEFLKINSLSITIDPGRLYTNLGNLFNGDKALGDNMNLFINDNWEDIYGELKSSVEEAFGAIFEQYAKRILERTQFKHIFLTE